MLMLSVIVATSCISTALTQNRDRACVSARYNATKPLNTSNKVYVDFRDVYYNPYPLENVKIAQRLVLVENELKEIRVSAKSTSYDNPRTVYFWYDGDFVQAAMASVRDSGNSPATWSCVSTVTNKLTYSLRYNSSITPSKWSYDRIEMETLSDDVPVSNSPDKECFGKQFPELGIGDEVRTANVTARNITLNVTQMIYSIRGSKYNADCCSNNTQNTTFLQLTEGKLTILQVTYKNRISDGFRYISPRNVTMLFSGDYVYVGMAFLFEEKYDDYGRQILRMSKLLCRAGYESMPPYATINVNKVSTVVRVEFHTFQTNNYSVVAHWDDTDYLLISVSAGAKTFVSIEVVAGVILVSLLLGDRFNFLF